MIFDENFTKLYWLYKNKFITEMCRICKAIASNKALVQEQGADCFPDWLYTITQSVNVYPECRNIKKAVRSMGQSKAKIMRHGIEEPNVFGNSSLWAIMAFESVCLLTGW